MESIQGAIRIISNAVIAVFAGGCFLAGPAIAADRTDDRPNVTFFISGDGMDAWNILLREVGSSAAEDLGIDLEFVASGTSRKEIYDVVAERISASNKPDYALIVNYRSGAAHILQLLDQNGIKSFMFNADLSEDEKAQIGNPREQLDNWIGRLIPDDEVAGYDLAKYLIAEAKEIHPGKTISIIGITGSYASTAAVKRMEGLRRAVEEEEDVDLKQVVTARWVPDTARQKYGLLKNRYGEFDVVWVANDGMAVAILEEIDPQTETIQVGGMDWTNAALDALEDGSMAASLGGHVLDIGYALAIIKRYDEGCDFASSPEDASLRSNLSLMTRETKRYHDLVESREWSRLDFSKITCEMVQSDSFNDLSIDNFYNIISTTSG